MDRDYGTSGRSRASRNTKGPVSKDGPAKSHNSSPELAPANHRDPAVGARVSSQGTVISSALPACTEVGSTPGRATHSSSELISPKTLDRDEPGPSVGRGLAGLESALRFRVDALT